MKVLLATFYTPGLRAIEFLIQAGFRPDDVRVLTHATEKNGFLIDFMTSHGIEIRTDSVKSGATRKWIESFTPHVIFSLYFRDVIPQAVLDIPALGAVNLHPALLPRYRGTFSAPWAIINGEPHTGFTYHYMLAQVDAGNIVLQRKIPLKPVDTAYSLYHRLVVEGMAAFGEAYRLVVEEKYPGEPQRGEASYYPRRVPFGGYIDPHWGREQIERFIRAMYFPPFTGALVRLADGRERQVLSVEEYDQLVATGCVLRE